MASDGGTSVQVALRIKPITEEDLEKLPSRFQRQVITTSHPNKVVVEGEKRQIFHFDYVFPPETTQQNVYEKAVENLVGKFLEGYNVTILAYGQTSSGKTYTMGTADNASMPYQAKGIIPRAMSTLFDIMNNSSTYLNRKFSMKVSFIEIYNEDLIDLLGEGEGENRPQVMIREDSKGNIYWSGLQEVHVNNVDDVMAYLAQGSTHRQVGATDMNSKSSRSHAIFSITMSQQKLVSHNGHSSNGLHAKSPTPGSRPTTPSSKLGSRANSRLDFDDGDWITISSKFHFVDLAGSERLKRTAASGDRAKEGISINSGLLALGNVISALGDPTKAKHTTHIPYRDSKLTRLLQDSLGGNAQTLMIACVSPVEFNLNETVNTLKYANRARNIKNTASINQEETGWNDIVHLQNLVIKLRSEITHLKVALSTSNNTNGTISPGRNTPVGGRETPSRIKSPTGGSYSTIPSVIGGRATTPTGRKTPTSSGIPGPSGITGRSTPTSGIPGPSGKSVRRPSRPSRPSSPLTTFSQSAHHHKDMESMEDQLLQLQHSYAELSQKYAKTSAELAMHQDNYEELQKAGNDKNFMKAAEPVIEEYEKTISSLESKLAITIAALSHAESLLKEEEDKVVTLEKNQEQTKSLNTNLQKYIRELELKLEKREVDAKLGTVREEHPEKFVSETVKILEERLNEREVAYKELEEKLKLFNADQDKRVLVDKISSRDRRISFLDAKLSQLGDEVEKLRSRQDSNKIITAEINGSSKISEEDLITIKSLEEKLQQTETQLNETKLKYEESLSQIQELQSRYDSASTPITPMTPMTPATPHNEYNSSNIDNIKVHRKAKSLSNDLKSEKRNLAHAAIVEKLQFELKLFESFNKDKQQSLDSVRHELELLEIDYRETLQLVDELRDELKNKTATDDRDLHTVETSANENEEILLLRERVAKLQAETVSNKDHENTIRRLENELEKVKEAHKLAVQEEKPTTLTRDITDNDETSADKLEQNVDENVLALEDDVRNLETQLSSLKSEIKNKDDTIKQELENKGLLQKSLKDRETELAILKKQLMDLRKQDEDVQRKMKELQAKLGDTESIKEINQSLEDELENIEKELKDVKEKEAQALEQLRVLGAEESKLQEELVRLRNVEITQRERIVVLEAQLSDQGAQIDNELINVRSELAISKESEIANKQTITELESKLSKSESIVSTLQSEIEGLNSKENETLIKLRKELSDTKLEMDSQNELLSELGNHLTTTEKERDQYSERANELSGIIEQRKEEIKDLELKTKNLENEINDTKDISQTYQDEMKSLGEKLSNLEAQLGDAKTSNKEYVQKIDEFNIQLTEKQELISTKDTQIKELEVAIENIKKKLADAELFRSSESDQVKSLLNKIAEIEAELEQSPSPADLESAQQYAAKQTELVKELERKIDEINKTNSLEVAKMNENIDNLTKTLEETRSESAEQNSLIYELESELKDKEDKMKEMLDNIDARLVEKNEHLSVKENLEQQVQKLQKEIDSTTKELTHISAKYKDAEVLLNEYKVQISKLEVSLEEATKLPSDHQQTDGTLETSPKDAIARDNLVKSLQEKITELEHRTLDSQSNPTDPEIEIKELNQKISKLEEMNEEKSKLIESLKENAIEINETEQKLEKLQREKNDLVKEIEPLKAKLEEKTSQYEQLEISVQKQKEEVENILEEERKAKKNVEAAYASLENQIEELQVTKRSRFMCF